MTQLQTPNCQKLIILRAKGKFSFRTVVFCTHDLFNNKVYRLKYLNSLFTEKNVDNNINDYPEEWLPHREKKQISVLKCKQKERILFLHR